MTPAPTNEALLRRYPFQARTYFATKLPHNWWIWGIDIQLDAATDPHQLRYFYRAGKKLGDNDRVILCTARPSWIDSHSSTDLDFETNRGRLAWFANRMFGNDDPDYPQKLQTDRMDSVPIVLSGDKHHYARYTRVATDTKTSPRHLVTCGGGGAYLSSTHHLKDSITVPWHLSEQTSSTYDIEKRYPSKHTSRGRLSAGFLRTVVKNGIGTPALVVALAAALAITLAAVLRGDLATWNPLGVAGAVVAVALPAVVAFVLPYSFRPRTFSWFRKFVTILTLGVLHFAGYAAAAAFGLWVAAVVAYGGLDLPAPDEAADHLWTGFPSIYTPWADVPWLPLTAGITALAAASLLVFALYFLVADLFGWHENEFFAGMGIEGYKSFIRITISAPATEGEAGVLSAVVYGVEKVPDNKSKAGGLADPTVTVIDTWSYTPTAVPPQQ